MREAHEIKKFEERIQQIEDKHQTEMKTLRKENDGDKVEMRIKQLEGVNNKDKRRSTEGISNQLDIRIRQLESMNKNQTIDSTEDDMLERRLRQIENEYSEHRFKEHEMDNMSNFELKVRQLEKLRSMEKIDSDHINMRSPQERSAGPSSNLDIDSDMLAARISNLEDIRQNRGVSELESESDDNDSINDKIQRLKSLQEKKRLKKELPFTPVKGILKKPRNSVVDSDSEYSSASKLRRSRRDSETSSKKDSMPVCWLMTLATFGVMFELIALLLVGYTRLHFLVHFNHKHIDVTLVFFLVFAGASLISDGLSCKKTWSYVFLGTHLLCLLGFFITSLAMIFAIGSIGKGTLKKTDQTTLSNLFWIFVMLTMSRSALAVIQLWLSFQRIKALRTSFF